MKPFHDVRHFVESIGPFNQFPVTVNGWSVPHLQAYTRPDGEVTLSLDNRFAVDLPSEDAGRIIGFVADCIAVAKGYASHPRIDGYSREAGDQPAPPLWPWRHMVGLTTEEVSDLAEDHGDEGDDR